MPRSPEQIQQEIDAARESLAATLDQLVHRGSPQRLSAQAQDRVKQWLASPAGQATLAAAGLFVTFVVVQKVRRARR
ncbi:DUF3618 domain-containing protein [Klenkia sp. PcliD-1-E]|uniref:DUF3618 domain-containing protein n=1 Tax=Klenkia sp. PcliD-1-E TaxID=2954492 RepID=UPI002097DDF3|nr:DUF3618 domain-containing protein [Klenkia sp. PcliD-1-E]MCO7220759.1 DUF3618 domain-containing protein [Klenkia sp. PcliD-1-E]